MKIVSDLVSIVLMDCSTNVISLNRGGLYIDSPEWMKNKSYNKPKK